MDSVAVSWAKAGKLRLIRTKRKMVLSFMAQRRLAGGDLVFLKLRKSPPGINVFITVYKSRKNFY